jgi:uncharacterized membrane protein YfcA
MPLTDLIFLTLLFFATSIVGVVTGSNSLVTVPVMFQFGIDEKIAVATNMFGLTFMAVGGTIPFIRRRAIDLKELTPLVILTIIGSALGALLVGLITNQAIRIIVSVAMIAIVLFTIFRRDKKRETIAVLDATSGPRRTSKLSYLVFPAAFLLAIYGGLYSGGYVTVLTATLIAFSGMNYGESIAATKFINVFSSGIATLIFMWQGLVDYQLGIILGVAMFAGAFIGAHYASKMNEKWLRAIFLSTVAVLAIKTLFDFF